MSATLDEKILELVEALAKLSQAESDAALKKLRDQVVAILAERGEVME
jgi:hypothetical protein